MNTIQQPIKYFLYIRKSTDEEDRQVLSLEAQLHEAKEFAERECLEIVESFVEKRTAKIPGREFFNAMLNARFCQGLGPDNIVFYSRIGMVFH